MQPCYDIAVEKKYKRIVLGLIDVVIPGFLIVYCFIVDRIKSTKYFYGSITLIGYVLGFICSQLALHLMRMAQPPLIYIVPFTLIPVVIAAWWRGHLKEMWYGEFKKYTV